MKAMDELIQQLCADLSREDWLLWSGHLIDNKADEIDPDDLATLIERREKLLAQPTTGLLGRVTDEVMH